VSEVHERRALKCTTPGARRIKRSRRSENAAPGRRRRLRSSLSLPSQGRRDATALVSGLATRSYLSALLSSPHRVNLVAPYTPRSRPRLTRSYSL